MKPSEQVQPEDPRVRFAGERTLLAWVRTGLAMMGFGFVIARSGLLLREITNAPAIESTHSPILPLWIGAGMIVLGIAVNVMAAVEHVRFLSRLKTGEPYQPPNWSLAVLAAIVLSVIGTGMVIYLVVLPLP